MIRLKAAAKINLFLDVFGKRLDGYHNIQSLLLPISLFDTIRIESRSANIFVSIPPVCRFRGIPWPFLMADKKENLVTRAAELLKKHCGCRKGAAIFLTKRIPIGAGLGGGSADAAAVLIGLNRLWKTGLSREQLMEIGAQIGCDVPALIHGGAICMAGRGETIAAVSRLIKRDFRLLLIYPGFAISTGDIYRRYSAGYRRRPAGRFRSAAEHSVVDARFEKVVSGLESGSLRLIGEGLFNAMEKTVFHKYPLLEMMKKSLEKAGAKHVLLTGSGSTMFVLLEKEAEGERIARFIRKQIDSPLWTQVVHTIGKRENEFAI
ncbi:MAG: 4-(cytidine 5'-diphospho)-2-C-methyl-D-erythritol kinase [Kiritimatiellae bacterium]|nr:4-(cytidine 5'-diphospho)-2-C-methyl-D-erythritol kinase [Kiritimatiellia bacterium]